MNIDEYLSNLKLEGIQRKIPNISFATANFIVDLLKKFNINNMLEIGCANGYSSLNWAKVICGKLHVIEISIPMFYEAFVHLQKCKLHTKVIGHLGNALDILPNFKLNHFDCIFIDANKKNTLDFIKLSIPLLKNSGLLIIDDVIKFEYKMHGLFDYLNLLKIKYNIEKIDSDDGILWAVIN